MKRDEVVRCLIIFVISILCTKRTLKIEKNHSRKRKKKESKN